MTDLAHDPVTHDDRLPWLEAAEEEDRQERVSVGKLIALILAALVALGIVIGGVWYLRSHDEAAPAKDPKLIAAQEGDYKVKPDEPGGMKVEGKGDRAFATSEGAEANGRIDNSSSPEAPVKGIKGTKVADAGTGPKAATVQAMPRPGGPLVAKSTAAVATGPMGPGTVQLGAFGSEAKANSAWASLSKRFSHVAPLSHNVVQAQVGGATVYRLRAVAGEQAGTVCSELKAAGENCIKVN